MKPSRRDLLIALNRAQGLFGMIASAAQDRNQSRAADLARIGQVGNSLCIEALRNDDPMDGKMPRATWLRGAVCMVDGFKLGERM